MSAFVEETVQLGAGLPSAAIGESAGRSHPVTFGRNLTSGVGVKRLKGVLSKSHFFGLKFLSFTEGSEEDGGFSRK